MKHILYFIKSIHSFTGRMLYFNLIGMMVISLLEGVGIFLLIPLVSLTGIFNDKSQGIPIISWMQDFFRAIPEDLSLYLILALYIVLIIGQGFFQRNMSILNARIQYRYMLHLREEMYKDLIQADWRFYLKNRKSDIINSMTTEITKVSGGTQMFLQFASSLIFTFIQIVLAFWLSPKMTTIVLLLGLALIFFSRTFIKKSSEMNEEALHLMKSYIGGITDHFNGIKDIKSNTLEEKHIAWIRSFGLKIEQNVIKIIKLTTISKFIFKTTSAFLIACFMFISIKMYKAQPAQLMLIIIIFSRLWPRFSGIQSNLEQLGALIPTFRYIINLKNECLESKELDEKDYLNAQPIIIEKGIECRNVSFRYDLNQSIYALYNINVSIPLNKMTAIVGRSGAGKSTFVDLLMGLNRPEEGHVLIDGNPLTNDSLIPLRRSISYVPQDPFLFNTTIRENLLMMKSDASEKQIWEALESSSIAEYIRKLPQGLDTVIGDRGVRMSGGERQRLVLARAILRKPSILVLDEATSALDTENERRIQEAIDKLKGKMTIIVIAHRLSTIRNAEQVIVLDQGRIVQTGLFNQLANEKRGMFSKLLNNQIEENAYAIQN